MRGLLALCTGLLADAVCTRQDGAEHPADRVARLTGLDMAQWWEATAASYFAQVPKARILEAVTAARGARDAAHLAGLKRDAMAQRAERLLAGTDWLPGPLRTQERVEEAAADTAPQAPAVLASAAD